METVKSNKTPTQRAIDDRQRMEGICLAASELIDLLGEMYPDDALPPANASDRDVGAWLAQRELIKRLRLLRDAGERKAVTLARGPR